MTEDVRIENEREFVKISEKRLLFSHVLLILMLQGMSRLNMPISFLPLNLDIFSGDVLPSSNKRNSTVLTKKSSTSA